MSKLQKLVADFQPDAVVTLMQDSWYYELAARYARKHRLPLILFIHDLPHIFEPVSPLLKAMQRRRDEAIYSQAAIRFCVSPGMESWFHSQFGIRGDVLLPPRSIIFPSQDPAKCTTLKQEGRLTLGFAGGLHYGYGEQILALVPVLRATNSRMELFGPTPSGKLRTLLDETDVLYFHGYSPTPEEAWSKLIERCDALILPYLNPPGEHHLQYQTHFPSKLGDMLSTGLPLLVCGPPDASGVSWFEQALDAAGIMTSTKASDLVTLIEKLRDDNEFRVRLATRAQEYSQKFDANGIQNSFHCSLNKLDPLKK
jgi:hypothetical protein